MMLREAGWCKKEIFAGKDNLPGRVWNKSKNPFTCGETAVAETFRRECPVIESKLRIYGAGRKPPQPSGFEAYCEVRVWFLEVPSAARLELSEASPRVTVALCSLVTPEKVIRASTTVCPAGMVISQSVTVVMALQTAASAGNLTRSGLVPAGRIAVQVRFRH
ncbi:MAG: hypothetical protein OXF29_04980 [Hyphomicrobiales bacterium]|nr:hypothetical protein [Hyphomicrobiales bacterium]